jgi:hypothetical protein
VVAIRLGWGSLNRPTLAMPPELKAEGPARAGPSESYAQVGGCYIIPLMSGMPPPPPPPPFFSGISATIASVVRMFLAIDAAF